MWLQKMNYFTCTGPIHSFYQLKHVFSPGSDQIQEVLPAVSNFVEFLFNLKCLTFVTGFGEAFSQMVQLELVFFRHFNLLLVVLRHNTTQTGSNVMLQKYLSTSRILRIQ